MPPELLPLFGASRQQMAGSVAPVVYLSGRTARSGWHDKRPGAHKKVKLGRDLDAAIEAALAAHP